MKTKPIAVLLILCLAVSLFAACGGTGPKTEKDLKIVCTIFPQYDWVREILGDRLADTDLTLLLDSGTDLHSYQPTAEDFVKLAGCDLFIYVGGESDMKWVPDALAATGNIGTLNLLEALGDLAKEEEDVAGMQEEEEEEEEGALDEHVWLSLKNAAALCDAICERLCGIDPDHAETYIANTQSYVDKLNALDAEYKAAVDAAAYKTVLVGDRFPFRYLCDAYGITPYAAFSGCSAESEASFETVAGLAKTLEELGLPAVVVTETADQSIAKTIIDNTAAKNQKIVVLDSIQSVTKDDIAAGKQYLAAMESNLNALKEALN